MHEHSSTRSNWSTLRELAVSPAKLRWRAEHPREDTKELRFGRALHCLVLEPDEFGERWKIPGPCAATKSGDPCGNPGKLIDARGLWYCRLRSHAPEDAAEPDETEILTAEQYQRAKACAAAVHAHKPSTELIEGAQVEVEMEWTDESGLLCRGRVDGIATNGTLFDLKSTRHETPGQFEREIARRLYHGQLAWYLDGAIRCGKLPKDAPAPRIISVSTGEMPDVARWALTGPDLEAGRIVYRALISRYLECQAAGWWPGHSPDERVVCLRDFDPGMQGVE